MTDYVGAGGRLLVFNEYTPAEWVIRASEIRTPDGRPLRAPAPIASATTSSSRRIELPREMLSTLGVQIVNNTISDVSIFLNGVRRGTVKMGGVYYVPAELRYGWLSRPLIITITTGACTYTETVWVNKYSQWARQIIFDAGLCGWNRWR
jgi:hypothetical protein